MAEGKIIEIDNLLIVILSPEMVDRIMAEYCFTDPLRLPLKKHCDVFRGAIGEIAKVGKKGTIEEADFCMENSLFVYKVKTKKTNAFSPDFRSAKDFISQIREQYRSAALFTDEELKSQMFLFSGTKA